MHYRPTARDILSSLPRDERNELLLVIETAPGNRGWVAVPDTVWTALTARVRRGDYDRK